MSTGLASGLVSVVVASYNHADFLVRRMDSLVNQTYPHIEIIVIDDCSSDNSLEVLRRYESHPWVRLIIREKNGGWVTVSNQGVEVAKGEFVIFANCDDDCDPSMIERLVTALQHHPKAGIAFCRSLMVDEYDQILGDDYLIREKSFQLRCKEDTLIGREEMRRFLMHSCVIPNLSAALFRKEVFSNVGYLSSTYRVCSDWDLFFRVVTSYDIAYIAAPLNKFRQHQKTIRSATKERVIYEEYFRLLFGQIKLGDLTFMERLRFRGHVMSLWAGYLISPAIGRVINFPYHFIRILKLDPMTLLLLVPALLARILAIVIFKLPRAIFKKCS